MRSNTEIREALVKALETQESGAWSRISQSIVGRELIAFGAEVIAATDNVTDSIVQMFDYKLADERALISLSHIHDVPISFNKPAYIRIRLSSKVGYSFNPYDLVLTVGNTKYTNIQYYTGNDDIILYQGVVKTMMSDGEIAPFTPERKEFWGTTIIPIEDDKVMKGHDIGIAMPESVYVYYEDEFTKGNLSEFTPLRQGPEVANYKLYTLMDKHILVLDGDGVWGKSDYSNPKFQILWLEPTEVVTETKGVLESRLYGKLLYKVMGSSMAEFNSLEYARDVFRRYYLTMNAVISNQQIHDYVKSFSYVNDCQVSTVNNIINVYIKPADPEDKGEYGNIEMQLDLHGGLFMVHEVNKGVSMKFRFKISAEGIESRRAQIETFLKTEYGYENLLFDTIVSCSEVASRINKKFGIQSVVTFITDKLSVVSGGKLEFIPIQNTIKIYDASEKVIGYDLNGQLFIERQDGTSNLIIHKNAATEDLICGKYLYNKDDSLLLFEGGYVKFASVQALKDNFSSVVSKVNLRCCTNNGYVFVYFNTAARSVVNIYDVSQINTQGLSSNIIPVNGNTERNMQVLGEGTSIPLYIDGNLYGVQIIQGGFRVAFYMGSSYEPYYSINIPVVVDRILGVYVHETDMYIVLENKTVITVRQFNSATAGWASVPLELPDDIDSDMELIGFSCYSEGVCGAVFAKYTNNQADKEVLIRCSGLSLADSQVRLLNAEKIAEIQVPITRGNIMFQVTEDYMFFEDTSNDKAVVVTYDGSQYKQDESIEYPKYVPSNNAVTGSVNYKNGTVVYDTEQGITLSYESSLVDLKEGRYLQLDESKPVLWN